MHSVSKREMIILDRRMVDEYDVSLDEMFEHAGRALAELTRRLYPTVHRIAVLIGHGNNGKGGEVAQRILKKSGCEIVEVGTAEVILDSLLGYSIDGNPHGHIAEQIIMANGSDSPILSLDMPSGLDPDMGAIYSPTIIARATLTVALPKRGLLLQNAKKYIGDLYIADIGVPKSWYEEQGVTEDLFKDDFIVRIN